MNIRKVIALASAALGLIFILYITENRALAVKESYQEDIFLGDWSQETLEKLISDSKTKRSTAQKIDFISSIFIGTPYQADTLTGDLHTPEVLTVNLDGLDCFTYLDYVEALRLSESFSGFKDNLVNTRYKNGEVSFKNRNHFFSDWPVNNGAHVRDVTAEVGGGKVKSAHKKLNLKTDGTNYLPGITVKERKINFIPSESLDADVFSKLQTGDYAGIYTEIDGLDVTHTGIIIEKDGKLYLRHASSRKSSMQVVEEDLREYMKGKPGLIVYRPIEP